MTTLGGAIHVTWGENRAFRVALLVSVALHALLLYALPDLRESHRRSVSREPLIARLLEPRVQPVLAAAPAIEEVAKLDYKPTAKTAPKVRPVSHPAPAPAEPQIPSAAPDLPKTEPIAAAPATLIAASPSVAAATGTLSMAPAAAADPASPTSAARGAAQSVPVAGNALDPGSLAQYRLAIISAARRYKRYPRAALDNNWQGRVEIRMVVGPSGVISAPSVRNSAGHEVLDQQALEMIEKAKAMAQIPASLQGREFIVDIPVIFSLREPDA